MRMNRMNGRIERLNRARGFGFIKTDDGSEFFFHADDLKGGLQFHNLKHGEKVTFEEIENKKGPRAGNVYSNEDL